jgi:hypothetical protein
MPPSNDDRIRRALWRLACRCCIACTLAAPAACVTGKDPSAFFACDIQVAKCLVEAKALSVSDVALGGTSYAQLLPPFPSQSQDPTNPLHNKKPYANAQFVANLPPSLSGFAHLVRTDFAKRGDDKGSLEITLKTAVAGVYVGFDERATTLPSWLANKTLWEPTGLKASVSMNDVSAWKSETSLRLYKHIGGTSKISLGANAAAGAVWPSTVPSAQGNDNRAMYVVVLEPKTWQDCSKPSTSAPPEKKTIEINQCGQSPDEAGAKAQAVSTCKRQYQKDGSMCVSSSVHCRASSCDRAASTLGLAMPRERSYVVQSRVEFDPAKTKPGPGQQFKAVVTVQGSTVTNTGVTGTLDFDYDPTTRVLLVQGLSLTLANMSFGSGIQVSAIKLALTRPFEALPIAEPQCALVPSNWPCPHYQIPPMNAGQATTGMVAQVGYSVNGARQVSTITNPTAAIIDIGGTIGGKRALHFKGFQSTYLSLADNSQVKIDVDLDLWGAFVNFAPNPAAHESTRYVECEKRVLMPPQSGGTYRFLEVNRDPITFSADGSVLVDGDAAKATYYWVRDYGTPWETYLAKGMKNVLSDGTLDYGVHHLTLLMFDPLGVSGRADFDLRVGDSTPPSLQGPGDIIAFQGSPGLAECLALSAGGYDSCAVDPVRITNDAPDPSCFGPGETVVTWTADDQRGNLTLAQQRVYVIPYVAPARVVDAMPLFASQVALALERTALAVLACGDTQGCWAGVEGVLGAVEHARAMLGAAVPAAAPWPAKLETLAALLDAAGLQLHMAAESAEAQERAAMRHIALDTIAAARDLAAAGEPR